MICTKCNVQGIHNIAGGNAFFYCRGCKEEILPEVDENAMLGAPELMKPKLPPHYVPVLDQLDSLIDAGIARHGLFPNLLCLTVDVLARLDTELGTLQVFSNTGCIYRGYPVVELRGVPIGSASLHYRYRNVVTSFVEGPFKIF